MIRLALTGIALGTTVALATPGPTPDPALMVCATLIDRAGYLEAVAAAAEAYPGHDVEKAMREARAAAEQAATGCR